MNISLDVPPALTKWVEGRARLELGLPPGSHCGHLVETLLVLYPGLNEFLASERKLTLRQIALFPVEPSEELREGQHFFLTLSTTHSN